MPRPKRKAPTRRPAASKTRTSAAKLGRTRRRARSVAARAKTRKRAASRRAKPAVKRPKAAPSKAPRTRAARPSVAGRTTRKAAAATSTKAPRTPTPKAAASKPKGRRRGLPSSPLPVQPAPAELRRPAEAEVVEGEPVPSVPSSLTYGPKPSAARSGARESRTARRRHTETGPAITAGDVDANWEVAYSSGDEAPGGDNPTPDQEVVEEIGRALGVEYDDAEELKSTEKIRQRDQHRWELDPASAEDYQERSRKPRE